jgi:hypothetical protein
MIRRRFDGHIALAFITLALVAGAARAADSFTNSLTGFTGDSTLAATRTALAAAGFDVTDAAGAAIFFDSSGAVFGATQAGDEGRNYLRTSDSDYANVSFVAEVTWVTTDIMPQASYFGLGSGELGEFRIADWGTEFSAVQLFQEINDPFMPEVSTLKNDNTLAVFDDGTAATGLDTGTNRLRLTYDWFRKTADFAIDVNYAGGPFVADVTTPTVHTLDLYGADGWPSEPARVYFGGDDAGAYKDFQVTVTSSPVVYGDLDNNGTITASDWMVLRTNLYADVGDGTHQQAYFLGDLTADLAVNHSDFFAFKTLFEAANGAGSFHQMLASLPEPTTVAWAVPIGWLFVSIRLRAAHRR